MKYTELESSLLEGRLIRRKGWNQGDFIFRQVPAKISLEIVPKMQSLPEEAKNEFLKLKEEISTGSGLAIGL